MSTRSSLEHSIAVAEKLSDGFWLPQDRSIAVTTVTAGSSKEHHVYIYDLPSCDLKERRTLSYDSLAHLPGTDEVVLANATSAVTMRLYVGSVEARIDRGKDDSFTYPFYSPNGKYIAIGMHSWRYQGPTVKVWLLARGNYSIAASVLASASGCPQFPAHIGFLPHSERMFAIGRDGFIYLWALPTLQRAPLRFLHRITGLPQVGRFAWIEGGDYTDSVCIGGAASWDSRVIACGVGSEIRLYDIGSGQPMARLRGHSGSVTAMAFGPYDRYLVSASYDGTVRLWDPRTAQCTDVLEAHEGGTYRVRISSSGSSLLSVGKDGCAKVWSVSM